MSLLSVEGLFAGYGRASVLHDVSLSVEPGEIVLVLGANGAGKTTLLRALTGMIPCSGEVALEGRRLNGEKPERRARRGLVHVPEGRGTLKELTVEENLRLGAYLRGRDPAVQRDVEGWLERFPRLRERLHQRAGNLSGGEQQMLAIARAMLAKPRLLVIDEPSLGLAPLISRQVFELLADANAELGTAMLIVEQNATLGLGVAERALVMETGRIVLSGTAEQVSADDDLRRAYLGY